MERATIVKGCTTFPSVRPVRRGILLKRGVFPPRCGTLGADPRTQRSPSSKPRGERSSPFGCRLQMMKDPRTRSRGAAPGEHGEWAPSAAPVRPSGAGSSPTGWRRVRGRDGN
ncbi:hypothetical protein EVAR_98691_1 [Eumeta japonica]|uniref:Uncharacterized protein n=1 Tax=Eumeta variegata TaxID=151549 RepID=A0A4C1XUI4_EUMVA|nr:hypothetical protein EVAR_98691_1 [Eumeta japonica]